MYAWGENNYGQVGNETTTIFDGSVPRQVKHELEKKNVIHIACGSTFNVVITDDNKLYGWGNNESKQILIDNVFEPSRSDYYRNSTISNSRNSQKHYAYPREIIISKKIGKLFFLNLYMWDLISKNVTVWNILMIEIDRYSS